MFTGASWGVPGFGLRLERPDGRLVAGERDAEVAEQLGVSTGRVILNTLIPYSHTRSETVQLEHMGRFSLHCRRISHAQIATRGESGRNTLIWRRLHSRQPFRDFL
jgi:hypothetical protein